MEVNMNSSHFNVILSIFGKFLSSIPNIFVIILENPSSSSTYFDYHYHIKNEEITPYKSMNKLKTS